MHLLSALSRSVLAGFCLALLALTASAQITTFTYQGRLTDQGNPANGNFELQFTVFDTPGVGTGMQQASPITTTATVSNGVFTVALDFGSSAFNGANRYLEIAVRPAGSAIALTTLSPRHAVSSSPYAITSLTAINAQNLGGVSASRFISSDVNGNVGIGAAPQFGKLYVQSATGTGVHAASPDWVGVVGYSGAFEGVRGESASPSTAGVGGYSNSGTGIGVWGQSNGGKGVWGKATGGTGVYGESAAVATINNGGVFGVGTGAGGIGVIGKGTGPGNTVGVYGESTSAQGFGMYGRNLQGWGLYVDGNARQTASQGGFVKAMIRVNNVNQITHCFNSTIAGAAANAVPCGFSLNRTCSGSFCSTIIDFGFDVNQRFWATTVGQSPIIGTYNTGINVDALPPLPNSLRVKMFATDEETYNDLAVAFSLIVF